jgi:ArsR family transcriptional regulator
MEQSNMKDAAAMARIFKALSNPQRLELFQRISRGFRKGGGKGCCAGVEKAFTAACDCMDLSRSTISHHFKELQNAGLIKCERRGQSFYCEVNREALKAIQGFMK